MDHSTASSVGVDISKDHLDACLDPGGEARRFSNDAKGHRALIAWLSPRKVARVVFEATGAYHRPFAPLLQPACRQPRSTRAKPGALPRSLVVWPELIAATPRCWPGSAP